jgi:hypothetical protein
LHRDFIENIRPIFEQEQERVKQFKIELIELKEQQTQDKQQLSLQFSEGNITRQQVAEKTLEISKKYSSRIDEISDLLHTL